MASAAPLRAALKPLPKARGITDKALGAESCGRLAAEFNETAELEATLRRRARPSVGIALVCRPWTFSATAALRWS
jgi:hypothetical protein